MSIRLYIRDVNQFCPYLDKEVAHVAVDVRKMLWNSGACGFQFKVEVFKPVRKNTFMLCNEYDAIRKGSKIRVVVVFESVLEGKHVFEQLEKKRRINNESFLWNMYYFIESSQISVC